MLDEKKRTEIALLDGVPGYNLLSSKEVAAAFGISEGTLAGMVRRGEIPIIRLAARTVRFYEDDLRRWIRKHRVFSVPPEKKIPA